CLVRPGASCVEAVVDGAERHVERGVALDKRSDLAAPDFGGDERAWTYATRQLEQAATTAPVEPFGTRVRLPLLVAINPIPRGGRVLDEPQISRHMREARERRHVIRHVCDYHGRRRLLGTNRRRDAFGQSNM